MRSFVGSLTIIGFRHHHNFFFRVFSFSPFRHIQFPCRSRTSDRKYPDRQWQWCYWLNEKREKSTPKSMNEATDANERNETKTMWKTTEKNAQFPRQLAARRPKRWRMRCIKISLPEILHVYPFRRPVEQEQDWNLYFLHIQFNLFFMAWNSHQHANTNTNQIHGILYKIFAGMRFAAARFLSLSLSLVLVEYSKP